MKKTSLMQSLQTRFCPAAWRNGLMLLLLVCVMGVSEANAQSIVPVGNSIESEYLSPEAAAKLLSAEIISFESIKVTGTVEYARRKFYSEVEKNLQNGLSVEDALVTSRNKVSDKALVLSGFTVSDVTDFYNEVDDKLKL